MKTIKFGYMNDERQEVTVRVLDARYDAATATGDIITSLQPCEYREFEVQMPDDAILYLKKWPKMILLSYHAQIVPQQASPPVELPPDAEQALKDLSQE